MEEAVIRKRSGVFEIDDGGSFDRLVQESRRSVFGCSTDQTLEAEATTLLQLRVVEVFFNRLSKDHKLKKITTCRVVQQEKKKTPISLKVVLKRKPEATESRSDERNMKKKAKKTKTTINQRKKDGIIGLEPPKLSINLQKTIQEKGGTDLKLVIMKQMFAADLKPQQGRLTIPQIQIRDKSFLAIPEISVLSSNEKLPATLMAPCGHEITMVFTKWRVNGSYSYALITHWNKFLDRNLSEKYFKVGDVIQLWSFMVAGELWFVIDKVKVRDAPPTPSD